MKVWRYLPDFTTPSTFPIVPRVFQAANLSHPLYMILIQGSVKIQIKPTRGNWTQFYTLGSSIKGLYSYLMRTRKQADTGVVGYHSVAGKGEHAWGRNQHWRRNTGSRALHLSPWIKPHLMLSSSPKLKPVWVGFQLICHLIKLEKVWLMQCNKCL